MKIINHGLQTILKISAMKLHLKATIPIINNRRYPSLFGPLTAISNTRTTLGGKCSLIEYVRVKIFDYLHL